MWEGRPTLALPFLFLSFLAPCEAEAGAVVGAPGLALGGDTVGRTKAPTCRRRMPSWRWSRAAANRPYPDMASAAEFTRQELVEWRARTFVSRSLTLPILMVWASSTARMARSLTSWGTRGSSRIVAMSLYFLIVRRRKYPLYDRITLVINLYV